MNDEFLHALRRDPPPEFARELQRRLQHQSVQRSPGFRALRTLLAAFLIGGVAMAAALLLRGRDEASGGETPIAQVVAPQAPAREKPPAVAPRTSRQVPSIAPTQPPAAEPPQKDIPVTLMTSSLARPLAQALVEGLSKQGYYAQPRVGISDGDDAFRALCGNADFVMASRRISAAELALCQKWGIDVMEWKLGYQAVVLSAGPAAQSAALTPRDVFLALAKRIADPADPARLIDNPNATWHDVDARFDHRNIDVLAPADATTRALLVHLLLEPGCDTFPSIRSLRYTDYKLYNDVCHQLRGDGRYREVELSNTVITQRLWAEPNWLIVLGYSYYTAHRTELLGTMLEGPAPTLATLTDGTYPAARPVYVYARKSHLDWNPAARMLAYQLSDESALGAQRSLLRYGLVPLDDIPLRSPTVRPSLPPALESLQPSKEHSR